MIIRTPNARYNDTMRDVIGDLCERTLTMGLPLVGVFETFQAVLFDGHPACALGILPEELYVVASESDDKKSGTLMFFTRRDVHTPMPRITRLVKLTLPASSLTKLAVVVALFFFIERGWFANTNEEEARESMLEWIGKYFGHYEDLGNDVWELLNRLADKAIERTPDGKLIESFQMGSFKVE
jgi:hypothetical protein